MHLEFYKKDVPSGMWTPWNHLVSMMKKEFQEVIQIAQKTVVTPHVQRQAQMSQMMTQQADARPQADISSVARCSGAEPDRRIDRYDVSDLEPTTDELGRKRKRA